MEITPSGGPIGYFLKFLLSNIRSHVKDSKWGTKYIFMNAFKKYHFSLQMGNCPIPITEHSEPYPATGQSSCHVVM